MHASNDVKRNLALEDKHIEKHTLTSAFLNDENVLKVRSSSFVTMFSSTEMIYGITVPKIVIWGCKSFCGRKFEPRHDKTNKMAVRPAKTQISLGIRPVWSESSLSAWRKVGSLATHWTHNKGSDQTGRMPRLIWVFVGRIATFLVLS